MIVDRSRPPLPPGSGVHSIQLDLESTRDELAHTLDDLFASFNLRLIVTSRPVLVGALLVVCGGAAVLAGVARRRPRGVRD